MSKAKKFKKSLEENKFDTKSNFKTSFKYYKSRNPPPDLSEVIDVDQEKFSDKFSEIFIDKMDTIEEETLYSNSPINWKIYKLKAVPGIVLIKNIFSKNHQARLENLCVKVQIFFIIVKLQVQS